MNQYCIFIIVFVLMVLVNTISQVMLKKASQKEYATKIDEYLNPLVIGAYVISTLSTLGTSFAYKGVSMSLGAILGAFGYVFITIFGVTIFHEKMNYKKIIAVILIIAGAVCYSV